WLPQVCRVVNGTPTGLCDYSRVGAINLAFAAETTIFHAIISIIVPILLVELLLPRRAAYPWLGRKAPFAFIGAGLLVLAFGVLVNIAAFQQHGLPGPFAEPYLIELALMALLIAVSLAIRPRVESHTHRRLERYPVVGAHLRASGCCASSAFWHCWSSS